MYQIDINQLTNDKWKRRNNIVSQASEWPSSRVQHGSRPSKILHNAILTFCVDEDLPRFKIGTLNLGYMLYLC